MQQISAGNKKNKEELEYRKAMRICRENPCFHRVRTTDVEISEACLAWNFDTIFNVMAEKLPVWGHGGESNHKSTEVAVKKIDNATVQCPSGQSRQLFGRVYRTHSKGG